MKIFLLVLTFGLFIGCFAKKQAINFPDLHNFSSIKIMERWDHYDNYGAESTIINKEQIELIFSLLKGKEITWRQPYQLYASVAYKILLVFYGENNSYMRFDIFEKSICYSNNINPGQSGCIEAPEIIEKIRMELKK